MSTKLFDALLVTANKQLTKLYLGRNKITDRCAKEIAHVLESNSTNLQELDLSWNTIWAPGGCMLADGIKNYFTLRVLDLSWNNIGKGKVPPRQVGKAWGACFERNTTLIHVDLSFNKIGQEDT